MILKRLRSTLQGQGAFTLIELMIVVVVIGILAAVAIPQFIGQTESARQSKAKADLKTIGLAIELYCIENENTLPEELEDLIDAGYLRSVVQDPWGKDYGYCPQPNGNIPFTLYYERNEQRVYYPPGLESKD